MCSISGFSLVPGSRVNSRVLANALLTEGEVRGTDASGWAYTTREGKRGMFKKDVPGSQLSLKGMPRKADAVILHTRFATQGHQSVNENNHPQISPNGNIRLVHNGHIDNDKELREILSGGHSLPTVDTSVIPAVIEEFGTDGTELIAGYAAVAWLDDRAGNTVHLSRLSISPVAIARLLDGSIVFASTEKILASALMRSGIQWVGMWPHTFMELDDGDFWTITDGVIESQENLGWYEDYRYTWSGSRGFAGAKSTMSSVEDDLPSMWPSEGGYYVLDDDGVYKFHEGEMPDNDTPIALGSTGPSRRSGFYTCDHDGDFVEFTGITGLVQYLLWVGNNSEQVLTSDKDLSWVNAVLDLGEIRDDGELVSWVANPTEIEPFDAADPDGLQFVIDGVAILQNVMVG